MKNSEALYGIKAECQEFDHVRVYLSERRICLEVLKNSINGTAWGDLKTWTFTEGVREWAEEDFKRLEEEFSPVERTWLRRTTTSAQ